jgi:hypothetical protein
MRKIMKINIVNYEKGYGENWIFTSLAEKINSGFQQIGLTSIISSNRLENYDIYFHISYGQAVNIDQSKINIAYITHIDDIDKLASVVSLAHSGAFCLCMSNDTAWRLNKYSRTNKFFSVLSPAIIENPTFSESLELLFSYRIYQDGRKNVEDVVFILNFLAEKLSLKANFIGSGWEFITDYINMNKTEVSFSNFDKLFYVESIKKTDYLIYTGWDEGAISVLDALIYNKKILATAQGYHLEYLDTTNLSLYASRDHLAIILNDIINIKIKQNSHYQKLTSWSNYCQRIISELHL